MLLCCCYCLFILFSSSLALRARKQGQAPNLCVITTNWESRPGCAWYLVPLVGHWLSVRHRWTREYCIAQSNGYYIRNTEITMEVSLLLCYSNDNAYDNWWRIDWAPSYARYCARFGGTEMKRDPSLNMGSPLFWCHLSTWAVCSAWAEAVMVLFPWVRLLPGYCCHFCQAEVFVAIEEQIRKVAYKSIGEIKLNEITGCLKIIYSFWLKRASWGGPIMCTSRDSSLRVNFLRARALLSIMPTQDPCCQWNLNELSKGGSFLTCYSWA